MNSKEIAERVTDGKKISEDDQKKLAQGYIALSFIVDRAVETIRWYSRKENYALRMRREGGGSNVLEAPIVVDKGKIADDFLSRFT